MTDCQVIEIREASEEATLDTTDKGNSKMDMQSSSSPASWETQEIDNFLASLKKPKEKKYAESFTVDVLKELEKEFPNVMTALKAEKLTITVAQIENAFELIFKAKNIWSKLNVIREMYESYQTNCGCVTPSSCPRGCTSEKARVIGTVSRILASRTFPNPYKNLKKEQSSGYAARDLLLWSVLHVEFDLSRVFFENVKWRMAAALVVSGIFYRYHLKADEAAEQELSGKLEIYSRYYEEIAVKMLTQSYQIDVDKTYELLNHKIDEWGKDIDCLNLAHHCKRQQFVGHSIVQKALSKRWFGGMKTTIKKWRILLAIVLPIFVPCLIQFRDNAVEKDGKNDDGNKNAKEEAKDYFCKILKFYCAPITKFILHMLFYMLFMLVFSYFVMVELRPLSYFCVEWKEREDFGTNGTHNDCLLHRCNDNGYDTRAPCIPPIEIVIYLWIFGFIFEEVRQWCTINDDHVYTIRGIKSKFLTWFKSDWNKVDFGLMFVLGAAILLRILVYDEKHFVHVRNAYALMLALYILRFIQFHFAHRYIGPKVLMIRKVMKEIIVFSSIFVVFLLAYGTAAQSLLYPNYPLNSTLLKQVVYHPYWQVYGELNLKEVEGKNKEAMAVVLFAIYMLFCNVLLTTCSLPCSVLLSRTFKNPPINCGPSIAAILSTSTRTKFCCRHRLIGYLYSSTCAKASTSAVRMKTTMKTTRMWRKNCGTMKNNVGQK